MSDRFLEEAAREVDALTPGSPPIAPIDTSPKRQRFHFNAAEYHGWRFNAATQQYEHPDGRAVSRAKALLDGVKVFW